jgi:hypothetical protein
MTGDSRSPVMTVPNSEEVIAASTSLPCATLTTDLALLSEDPWVSPELEKVGDAYMPAPPWTFHSSL